jgi:hypothetical protein
VGAAIVGAPATVTIRYSNGTAVGRPIDIAMNGTVVTTARS